MTFPKWKAAMAWALAAAMLGGAAGAAFAQAEFLEELRRQEFGEQIPYKEKYIDVQDARMRYVDEGEGTVFVFFHGNPTSLYLWRNVMPYVAEIGRVVAFDNVGFGGSSKPDIGYTFQEHARYVNAFMDALGLRDVVLVGHDWGGGLALQYARRHGDNVRGLVLMEAVAPPTFPLPELPPGGAFGEIFRGFRDPVAGPRMILDENMFVERLLIGGAVTRTLSAAEMEAYRAPFLERDARYPIYVWPNELPIGGEPARNVEELERIDAWLRGAELPKLVQYATPGVIMPPSIAASMAERYPNTETQFVGYGLHFIQEDQPQAIGRGIVDWARRNVVPDARDD
ncbi:MAG: haloalkane dehalogenase [Parvularculaceae bacterium]